jgi:glutamate formiminotransferase/formiminotetrahydrofolate cyclodeaminase
LREFANETAGESPAPGGGSIAAYVGALGVSLGTMVANLSAHKRGWDDKWEFYSKWAVKGAIYKENMLALVDEDTSAFNKIMDAFGLPKGSEEEKSARSQAIQDATKYAIEVPMLVMETAFASMEVMNEMVDTGLQSSLSDAAVGALCARTAVMGAFLNVKINTGDLTDQVFKSEMLKKGAKIEKDALALEAIILEKVNQKL